MAAAKVMVDVMAELGGPFSSDFQEALATSLDIFAHLTDYIEHLEFADRLFALALEQNGTPGDVWRDAVGDWRWRLVQLQAADCGAPPTPAADR
jgi:hypothetical protein